MKIFPKCCGLKNPIGITEPNFSWVTKTDTSKKQISYRISVYTTDYRLVWDSGTVPSDQSVYIKYEGVCLSENTKYFWDVTVTTEERWLKSEPAFFITGLYHTDGLSWISAPKGINSPQIHREFLLEKIPAYSLLNICGLGFFEVCINGQSVSDDLMNPVRTDYDTVAYRNLAYPYTGTTQKCVKYLTYEVSKLLKPGSNVITVWLGNGWYRQKGRTIEGLFDYGDELKMFFRLTSGETMIESDLECYCTESPILSDNIFYGEVYDARVKGEAQSVHRVNAPEAKLEPQLCPSERIIHTLTPSFTSGIYDAGKCMAGFAEISCAGTSGSKIEIFYAEEIDSMNQLDYKSTVGYGDSDRNQIQKDTYILNGGKDEVYAPRFVWHAFRYFKISAPENVMIKSVKVHFVSTDLQLRACFQSSNELLNRIHQAMLCTQLSNVHGCVPMDCPHRERLGYTGDGQLSSLSVMYNYDAHSFYSKWVSDILDAQDSGSGFVPHTAPFHGGGGGPAWGSAVATVAWNMFMQYGDTGILKKAHPHIKKWIKYLTAKREDGFVTHEEEGSWCLGDWCMPSRYPWDAPHPDEIKIPPVLVNTVYYIHCIDIYNKIADILGAPLDFATEKATSVNAVNGMLSGDTYATGMQGCNLFPLFVGIVPKTRESDVFDYVINRIVHNRYCFETGISGTSILLKVLDKYQRNDVALKMFLNTEYPGFGNMIVNGATALWETWEGNGSKNHTGLSSADAWLFYGLAGIRPSGGYKEFTLRPYFAEELDHLDAALECEYGTISLSWIRKENHIEVEFSIPFNTTAHIDLNGKCFSSEPGTYREVIVL